MVRCAAQDVGRTVLANCVRMQCVGVQELLVPGDVSYTAPLLWCQHRLRRLLRCNTRAHVHPATAGPLAGTQHVNTTTSYAYYARPCDCPLTFVCQKCG